MYVCIYIYTHIHKCYVYIYIYIHTYIHTYNHSIKHIICIMRPGAKTGRVAPRGTCSARCEGCPQGERSNDIL